MQQDQCCNRYVLLSVILTVYTFRTEYLFNFDQPFEIHDDIEVLKRLGLAHGLERAEVSKENRPKVRSCLPPALRDYVDQILEGCYSGFSFLDC